MGDGELSRKARENRARRAAARQGLRLRKNPRRDARAVDYGSYMLTDPGSGGVVADFGWDRVAFGDHLADVEEWLARGSSTTSAAGGALWGPSRRSANRRRAGKPGRGTG